MSGTWCESCSSKSRRYPLLVDLPDSVVRITDVGPAVVQNLLSRYSLRLVVQPEDASIAGSYWGDDEAGIVGHTVYVRGDTPLHSALHEACHTICMTADRRETLDRDAGGDDLEEAAVCYLQIVLADEIAGVSRERLMRDMDAWGYSFRLGSTARWFADDAADARKWLLDNALLDGKGRPIFRLRH